VEEIQRANIGVSPASPNRKRGRPKKARKLVREKWPRVYRVHVHGRERFMVDARKAGFPKGKRNFYETEEQAIGVAEVLEVELINLGARAFAELSPLQRKDAIEALQILQSFEDATLFKAARHYADFLAAEAKRATGPTLKEALALYLEVKRAEHKAGMLRKLSIYDIESKTRHLLVELGDRRLGDIDQTMVEEFLGKLALSPRAWENVRLKSSQFFNFCVRRKWVIENPASGLAKKIEMEDVEILSVEAAEALLRTAQAASQAASVVPYLAVSLFAGLRPGEARQLRWDNVHFETHQIEVLKSTSKTKETRSVTLDPLLAEWLLPFRKTNGKIVGANFTKDWKAVRELAGYSQESKPWPIDVLRHTFGSYWLAIHQDRARLAEEMGNSVDVIKRFYKRAIPRQSAEGFWKLQPFLQPANILAFNAT
jgi:integrase